MKSLLRRQILKLAGVTLALPFLESSAEVKSNSIKRFVAMQMPFGFLAENLYPKNERDVFDSLYMQKFSQIKDSVTLYNGLHNPGINGGHDACYYFLTCGSKAKKVNSISVDQEIATRFVGETRFKSLVSGVSLRAGASYTRSGIKIPIQNSPQKVFEAMFLGGKAHDIRKKKQELAEGKSILDAFSYYSKNSNHKLSGQDKVKMDQYFTAIREVEKELSMNEAWLDKPLPSVEKPNFPKGKVNEIENFKVFTKIFKLALETDSTRLITYDFGQTRSKLGLDGVNEGYHGLSHHRLNVDKLNQLKIIEEAMFTIFSDFLIDLKNSNLLDSTICVFGSGLENPNNHSAARPPVIVAGGNLKHKAYVNFGDRPKPLGNLYMSVLDKMAIEKTSFGSSNGTLDL
ncbi:MAG: DUF1552 domain-containing protein [Lentisphaeraceae bacterium]|nr:DUF1552 domain-containing protein [Lentisphaeraceae bacterium]